jgi:ubiquinone/menaquinone biosynthesis C-methylase UbiE
MTEILYRTHLVQKILTKRRKIRVEFILSKINVFPDMSILDVGCGPNGRSFEDFLNNEYQITGIDIINEKEVKTLHPNFIYLKQDAQDLSNFRDNEFDLAVSIGMMEHICDRVVLKKMYSQISRVSRQWVIVVPWKYSVIEPHFKFPFFQLLPYYLQVFFIKALNLHNCKKQVQQNYSYVKQHYQWLTKSKWLDIYEGGKCFITPHMDTIAIVKKDINREL